MFIFEYKHVPLSHFLSLRQRDVREVSIHTVYVELLFPGNNKVK